MNNHLQKLLAVIIQINQYILMGHFRSSFSAAICLFRLSFRASFSAGRVSTTSSILNRPATATYLLTCSTCKFSTSIPIATFIASFSSFNPFNSSFNLCSTLNRVFNPRYDSSRVVAATTKP